MRKIALASAALFCLTHAHAQQNQQSLDAEINTLLPSNDKNEITAAELRQVLQDMVGAIFSVNLGCVGVQTYCIDAGMMGLASANGSAFRAPTDALALTAIDHAGTGDLALVATDNANNMYLGANVNGSTLATPGSVFAGAAFAPTLSNAYALGQATNYWSGVYAGQLFVFGSSSGEITLQAQAAAGTYNWNWPTSAGSSGQPLLSGGGSTAMSFGTLGVAGGGTGQTTLTNHGLLVGAGTGGITQLSGASAGTVLTGQGSSSDPSFAATPNLGVNGSTAGTLGLANGGSGGATVTIQNTGATSAYNFNLPTAAGSSGQPLLSGGGSIPMTFGTLGIGGGGTGSTGGAVVRVKVQKFTASGTYTPSAGLLYAIIECVGGGGGGGSAAGGGSTAYFIGGGGGSGSYSRSYVSAATLGASQAVTVGSGGNGGAAGSNNGAAGSSTSVGSLCVGNGGAGGTFGSTTQVPAAGAGGTAGTGDLAAAGTPGATGLYSVTNQIAFAMGSGASSAFGGGAVNITWTSSGAVTGNNAGNYGAGGSGGGALNTSSNAAGGNGSAGIAVITEYANQ
jgi:hypothetical protein